MRSFERKKNIRIDLIEIRCEDVDFTHLSLDRDQLRGCGLYSPESG
jgi:hypothetical protein